MKIAAIYARVSSDQQKEEKTIASQTAALVAFAESAGYSVPGEWVLEDEGYSGASLVRPGLERVRDLAAEGQIQAVLLLRGERPEDISPEVVVTRLLMETPARFQTAEAGLFWVAVNASGQGWEKQLAILRKYSLG